jgi:hypothetical protein
VPVSMANKIAVLDEENLKNRILTIRGLQVILDRDLAELYDVKIKRLNEQVKRNIERFPESFMFQLTDAEYSYLRSQFATIEKGRGTHTKYLPYAFTEQGVAMLSGVLKSDTAVKISIKIISTFVAMRRFLSKNSGIFPRIDNIERKQIQFQIETGLNFKKVFDAIESKGIRPEKGIFFDGQIFDSYKFVSDIIRSADKSIILIDNYIDDSVLTLFCKRKNGVKVTILTKEISRQLSLDLAKYNLQYPSIELREFKHSHDRFLIVDNKEVYHIGASLKDLGKKWFAFSRIDKEAFRILDRLGL